jgi:hypothetical protein
MLKTIRHIRVASNFFITVLITPAVYHRNGCATEGFPAFSPKNAGNPSVGPVFCKIFDDLVDIVKAHAAFGVMVTS